MVSVIIPSYNRESLIKRSVISVLNQEYSDIEVIVVDDCSTDNTLNVLAEIDDNRLKVCKLDKNSGACVARNKGIELAIGEYIAFQDSDDEFMPSKIKDQLEALKKNDADICVCQIERVGYVDSITNKYFPNCEEGFLSFDFMLQRSIISTQMILAKKEVFKDNVFDPQMPRLQDFDLMIRLAQKYKIYFLKCPLCKVYMQDDSITKSNDKGIRAYERLLKKYEDIWKVHNVAYSNMLENLAASYLANGEYRADLYAKSLRAKFSRRKLLKYILTKLRLIKLFMK